MSSNYSIIPFQIPLLPASIAVAVAVLWLLHYHASPKATRLLGPRRNNLLLGYSRQLVQLSEATRLCNEWEKEYGPVYEVPSFCGTREVILADPKAVMHYFSLDTHIYRQTPLMRHIFKNFFGKNLLWAEGDDHKRQRKALSPAFGNPEIRRLTPIFFDSAYALKTTWDAMLEDKNSITVDVAQGLDYVSLDTIGMAGFGHDFGSLKGKNPPIATILGSFGEVQMTFWSLLIVALSAIFSPLAKAPIHRNIVMRNLQNCMREISVDFLAKARVERKLNRAETAADKSILGLLMKSEDASTMSEEEIMGQHLMIAAGYETTAVAMTWALIELSKNPHVQERLRAELAQFSDRDPTWEQLTNGLPYLDAFTCETLRVHPPGSQTFKQAYEDDIVPLAEPVVDATGNRIDRVHIAKGTTVRVPIATMNTSKGFWGDDAKVFNPDRWLNDSLSGLRATEIQGYRHLLSFADGPRTCLGKGFALAEFKAVIFVLVRNYTFELPDGPNTRLESRLTLLERPVTPGRHGAELLLTLKRAQS